VFEVTRVRSVCGGLGIGTKQCAAMMQSQQVTNEDDDGPPPGWQPIPTPLRPPPKQLTSGQLLFIHFLTKFLGELILHVHKLLSAYFHKLPKISFENNPRFETFFFLRYKLPIHKHL
jgi:hypothetical protein